MVQLALSQDAGMLAAVVECRALVLDDTEKKKDCHDVLMNSIQSTDGTEADDQFSGASVDGKVSPSAHGDGSVDRLPKVEVARLEVRWMCSGDAACVVDATPSMTIDDVHAQVLEKTAVPVEQQKLFWEGNELVQQADLLRLGVAGSRPVVQLVRCHSDPRNTNRAFFRENLNLPSVAVGNFRHIKKLGNAIYGEVGMYKWKPDGLVEDDVAVKCVNVQKARQTLEKDDTNEWTAHLSVHNAPQPEDAYAEVGVLKYLSKQPDLPGYLLKLLTAFVQDTTLWVVTELAEGGELLDVVQSQKLGETFQTRRYLWQTLQAVKYLHAHRIGHRDISLENLLLKGDEIRLGDFGNAVQSHSLFGQELRYFLTAGKDTYRAPECVVPRRSKTTVVVPSNAGPEDVILHRESGLLGGLYQIRLPKGALRGQICQADVWGYAVQPADVFSCGVCFFCMSYGHGPWVKAELTDEFFNYVYTNGEKGLKDLLKHWGKAFLEADAMELLLSMMRIDPLTRPSAASCLESNWFRDHAERDDEML